MQMCVSEFVCVYCPFPPFLFVFFFLFWFVCLFFFFFTLLYCVTIDEIHVCVLLRDRKCIGLVGNGGGENIGGVWEGQI